MNFEFCFIYRHIYRKWVFLVDTKCFMMGARKGGTFSHQILNKNSLSLVHCALNRSFTVRENASDFLENSVFL